MLSSKATRLARSSRQPPRRPHQLMKRCRSARLKTAEVPPDTMKRAIFAASGALGVNVRSSESIIPSVYRADHVLNKAQTGPTYP
ncbi:hypothetical protein D3C72_2377240 [compost metagenome]